MKKLRAAKKILVLWRFLSLRRKSKNDLSGTIASKTDNAQVRLRRCCNGYDKRLKILVSPRGEASWSRHSEDAELWGRGRRAKRDEQRTPRQERQTEAGERRKQINGRWKTRTGRHHVRICISHFTSPLIIRIAPLVFTYIASPTLPLDVSVT